MDKYLTDPQEKLDFYWDMLMRVTRVEQGLDEHMTGKSSEFYTLKGLAFAGLIRNGWTFEKNYKTKIKVEEKVRKIGIIQLTSQEENSEPDELWITIRDDRRNEYNVEGAVLQDAMGTAEYNRIILGIEPVVEEKEEKKHALDRDKITDWIDGMEEDDVTGIDENYDDNEEVVEEKKEYLPEFITDTRYVEDPKNKKDGWTFWYNKHMLTIPLPEGTAYVYFYVYPLQIKQNEGATDIFVTAESGGMVRAGVSRGESKGVMVEFEDIGFMIRGSWKNGEFESIVRCLNDDIAREISEEFRDFIPEDRMATTYVRADLNGTWVNIFPARYGDNEDNGYALAACAVEIPEHTGRDGTLYPKNVTVVTPQEDGTFELDTGEGYPVHMQTYWFGDDPAYFNYEFDN